MKRDTIIEPIYCDTYLCTEFVVKYTMLNKLAVNVFWLFLTGVEATDDQLIHLNYFDVRLVITQIPLTVESGLKRKDFVTNIDM